MQPAQLDANSLWQQIVQRYDAAQRHKAASTFDTHTELVRDDRAGATFVLKVAAQLRDKPKPPPPQQQQPGAADGPKPACKNPFLPPDPELFVCHLSDTHSLVLNKFNVMPYHLLIITRQFESQLDPLNARDLAATLAAMQALPTGALAFYNCGPLSGASQPHKHVQVVPLPLHGGPSLLGGSAASKGASSSTVPCPSSTPSGGGGSAESSSGSSADPPFGPLVDAATSCVAPGTPVELRQLPFISFAARLPGDATPALLEGFFSQLLQRCGEASKAAGVPEASSSYNALLTRRFLMLVPRSSEAAGPVNCNSVAFAGSFFVRSEEELAYVRRDPLGILAAVGVPWQ